MQQLWRGRYFVDVRNTHNCYIIFDYARISLTRDNFLYEILDELVPILNAL